MPDEFHVLDEACDAQVESDGRVSIKYDRTYIFMTDSMTRPTPQTIATAMSIYPGSPYADDPNATAYSFKVRGSSKPTRPPFLAYHVSIGWATNAPMVTGSPSAIDTDPTNRRVLWTIKATIQQRNEISYYDPNEGEDVLIVNTAGQPFDGGVPVNVRTGVFTASRIVSASGYDKGAVMRYSGAINSDVYLGCEPGTLQVDIEAVEKQEGGYHYWEEMYTFNYDVQGHQPRPVSAGFFQKDPLFDGELLPITIHGQRVNEPEPLDEFGEMVPFANRPDDCVFVEVPYFEEIAFGTTFGLT